MTDVVRAWVLGSAARTGPVGPAPLEAAFALRHILFKRKGSPFARGMLPAAGPDVHEAPFEGLER